MIEKYNPYYEKRFVVNEILQCCKNRDFTALRNKANIRVLKVFNYEGFEWNLNYIGWNRNKQNLYRSVATLKDIPNFTFDPKRRSGETQSWYSSEYNSCVQKYDIFFDFDKKEEQPWKELLDEVNMFLEYLNDYQCPYVLIFSGSKGFQIIIDGDYVPILKIEEVSFSNVNSSNIYPHKKIVEDIKTKMDLKFLDLSNNGVNSKLCKVYYSLVHTYKILEDDLSYFSEYKMNIALPLDDKQIKNFKVEDMNMLKVLHDIKIAGRGDLERFKDLDFETKKKNVERFIKVFSFK